MDSRKRKDMASSQVESTIDSGSLSPVACSPQNYFPIRPKAYKLRYDPIEASFDEVKAIILDRNIHSCTEAAKKLGVSFGKLKWYLLRYDTTYAAIKLESYSDEEIIAAFGNESHVTKAAERLGVDPASLSTYLNNAKKHINGQLFGPTHLSKPASHFFTPPKISKPHHQCTIQIDEAKAVIKDKTIKTCDQAALKLGISLLELSGLLRRHKTTYTQVKLEDVTDAELISIFKKDSHMQVAAKKLGVEATKLSSYLDSERRDVVDQIFSKKPRVK